MATPLDLVRGTLDMMVLRALSWRVMHGYDIARWLERVSDDALRVEEGSLYPALHRLAARGWVTAQWGVSENNRQAKYYSLTRAGRKQLAEEAENWKRLSTAIEQILQAA